MTHPTNTDEGTLLTASTAATVPGMTGDARALLELTTAAAGREPVILIEDKLVAFVTDGEQQVHQVDLREFEEKYADRPRRVTGSVQLKDADSFVEYCKRHRDDGATTVWSNVEQGSVTAVFNDHAEDGDAGFGDHRATLRVQDSPDWKHWLNNNGKMLPQAEFAEHIEDGAASIVDPDAASMLELAQSFQAATKVDFESGDRLQSGEVKLTFKETTTARAGQTGSIDIPTMIELNLQVFEGGAVYGLKARFMYRITNGNLTLGYRLIRPDVARKLAFDDISATVSEGIALPIMAGVPRS